MAISFISTGSQSKCVLARYEIGQHAVRGQFVAFSCSYFTREESATSRHTELAGLPLSSQESNLNSSASDSSRRTRASRLPRFRFSGSGAGCGDENGTAGIGKAVGPQGWAAACDVLWAGQPSALSVCQRVKPLCAAAWAEQFRVPRCYRPVTVTETD